MADLRMATYLRIRRRHLRGCEGGPALVFYRPSSPDRFRGDSQGTCRPMTALLHQIDRTAVYRGHSWLRPQSRDGSEPREIDACVYLLTLCRHLQVACLEPNGIECLFDADGAGSLPDTICRMLGFMVSELVADSVDGRPRAASGGTIAVTLRRRGTTCLCTISCRGSAIPGDRPRPGLERVQSLAAKLGGSCMVRSMPDRGMIAIMFNARSVERTCSEGNTGRLS